QKLRPRRDADDEGADAGAADVDGGRERNGTRREAARDDVVLDRIDAEAPQQILAEDYGDAAEGVGADQHEFGPTEQKRCQPAPAFAEVGVKPSGFRERGGELAEREGAAERDRAAQDPQQQHHRRIRDFLRDAGRRPEDARSDRDADDEGNRAPQPERARELAALHGGERYHSGSTV